MPKRRVSANLLDQLLHDRAVNTPECSQCTIGPVVEAVVDEKGCNWKVSVIQGSHCFDCLAAMGDFITTLRQDYLLESNDDMDPALLTTWAVQ